MTISIWWGIGLFVAGLIVGFLSTFLLAPGHPTGEPNVCGIPNNPNPPPMPICKRPKLQVNFTNEDLQKAIDACITLLSEADRFHLPAPSSSGDTYTPHKHLETLMKLQKKHFGLISSTVATLNEEVTDGS